MKTVYSRNDEDFNFEEVGDVLDDMRSDDGLSVGDVYYEADAVDVDHATYIDATGILEMLDERAYDEIGECYNADYSGASQIAKQELYALLVDWSKKHVNLNYWIIKGKSRELKVTQEDIGQ